MDIFSNPWIVGIGGGVLSGFIVAYISRLIFSKRDNREYAQKISQRIMKFYTLFDQEYLKELSQRTVF